MKEYVGKIVMVKFVVPSLGVETPQKVAEVIDVLEDKKLIQLYLPDIKRTEWLRFDRVKIERVLEGGDL